MKSKLFIIALLAVLSLVSCQKEPAGQTSGEFTLSTDELTFAVGGGTQTVNVRTEADVTVASGDESWCTVQAQTTSSASMKRFVVTASANPSTSPRTTYLSVNVGGVQSDRISVLQNGVDIILAETSVSISAQAQSFTVSVDCQGDYELSTDAYWLTWDEPSSGSVRVNAAANETINPRSGVITFSYGSTDIDFTVVQEAGSVDVPDPDMSGMESDARTLMSRMVMGINLGNTLEATGSETAWGNPLTTEEIILFFKSLGFNAIRIPCSWHQYIVDQNTYAISDTWMNRVKEVVDYVVDNDMYAILNIHWDQGWLENDIPNGYSEAVDAEQRALWTQIATVFRDYDEHLVFAGTNEPNVDDAADMRVLLTYEQTFVDAVRATGGRNAYRVLVVQGPSTDIDKTVQLMDTLPEDTVEGRLAAEVHYYTPWTFCGLEADADWGKAMYFWGDDQQSYATGAYSDRWDPNYNESYVASQFAKMKAKFWDNGVPVILGEYAVCAWGKDGMEGDTAMEGFQKSCEAFNLSVTKEAKANGCVPFYWHAGNDLLNRSRLEVLNQGVMDAIVEGARTSYPN